MLAPRLAGLLRSAAHGLRGCCECITYLSATTKRTFSSGHKPSDIEALNKELDDFFGTANAQQDGAPPWEQHQSSSSATTATTSSSSVSSSSQAQASTARPQPQAPTGRNSTPHDWPRIHPPIYQAPLSRQAGAHNPLQDSLPHLPAFPTPITADAHSTHPQQQVRNPRTGRHRGGSSSSKHSSSGEDDSDFGDLLAVTAHGYAGGSTGDGAVTLGSPGVTAYDVLSHQQQQEGIAHQVSAAAGTSWAAGAQSPATTSAADTNDMASSSSSSSSSSTFSDTGLSHVDASGRASMVDVSPKAVTRRSATASCRVLLGPQVFGLVQGNQMQKGDVLRVAQLAGVMGAKHTALLIPLCHNLFLSKVDVQLQLQEQDHSVRVSATAVTVGQTGVEMEALTAASVAALTVYDMCKAVSKDIRVTDLQLEAKEGGRSGTYTREPPAA